MMQAQKLSVVLITKNEAPLIGECLASVRWADEIIVLDSGSSDNTCEIARQYGAKVYQHTDWPGFGKQRQLAQSYATGDMIFMIDADERVSDELAASIRHVLSEPVQPNKVYACSRSNFFVGKYMKHSGWYPDRVSRFYPNSYQYNDNLVHESLEHAGASVEILSGDLRHLTCLDLHHFQQKQLSYAHAWAQQRFQKGKRCGLFAIYGHTFAAWFKTLILRRGFLDGAQGWLLATVNAQYTYNKYAFLWALNHAYSTK